MQGSDACPHKSTKALMTNSIRTNYRTMTDKIVSEHEIIAKKQKSWLKNKHCVQTPGRFPLQYKVPSLITASNMAYTALTYWTRDRCDLKVIATYTPNPIIGMSSNHVVAAENTSGLKSLPGLEISMYFK